MEWIPMDLKHAFAELGLTLQASHAEVKVAYRLLAMRWHPDVNYGLETDSRMKTINVAYAVVCQHLDGLRRATELEHQRGKTRPANQAFGSASGFAEFDWKNGFATGVKPWSREPAKTPQAPQTPQTPVQQTLQLNLLEAAFGCVKRVSGIEPSTCVRCGGSGKNEGLVWIVDVHIHAGTLDGAEVQACDMQVRSSPPGVRPRFTFKVQLEKHPLFRLEQDRLSVRVPISFWRWSLGGEITVPTLEGSMRVKLPAKPTAMLVHKLGWPEAFAPHRRKPLFVMPHIIYPESLDAHERQVLQMLDARDQLPEVEGWKRAMQAWLEAKAANPA
jgi:DnaJ-class molecular chaperone